MPTELADRLNVAWAIPDDADGLAAVLNDTTKMTELHDEHGIEGWAVLNAAYQRAQARKDRGEIAEQLADQMEDRFVKIMESNGFGVEGTLGLNERNVIQRLDAEHAIASRSKHYNPDAPGAAIQHLFPPTAKGIGTALQAVFATENTNAAMGLGQDRVAELQAKLAEVGKIQAAYSSHRPGDGGYLMPESFRTDLLELSLEEGVTRPRATTIPMSTPKISLPAFNDADRSSNLFGGVQLYWTEEDADATESYATFKVIVLEPDTLTGYTEVPNETLMDAVASGAFFQRAFPKAMAFEEDAAFIDGDGTGRPLGWLRAPARLTVSKEAGQPASTFTYVNATEMYASMLPSSLNRAVWVINQTLLPELMQMGLAVGAGGSSIFQMNAAAPMPMTLFGRPVIVSEKVKALGTAGDINFVDLGFYLIGDQENVSISTSTDYKFKSRRTAFLITERVDGQPWLETTVTPRNGTALSPFVALETRS